MTCNANTIRLVIILFSRKRTNNIHFRFARLPLIFKTENKFQNLYWKVLLINLVEKSREQSYDTVSLNCLTTPVWGGATGLLLCKCVYTRLPCCIYGTIWFMSYPCVKIISSRASHGHPIVCTVHCVHLQCTLQLSPAPKKT